MPIYIPPYKCWRQYRSVPTSHVLITWYRKIIQDNFKYFKLFLTYFGPFTHRYKSHFALDVVYTSFGGTISMRGGHSFVRKRKRNSRKNEINVGLDQTTRCSQWYYLPRGLNYYLYVYMLAFFELEPLFFEHYRNNFRVTLDLIFENIIT